jgi:hypothetical protein
MRYYSNTKEVIYMMIKKVYFSMVRNLQIQMKSFKFSNRDKNDYLLNSLTSLYNQKKRKNSEVFISI